MSEYITVQTHIAAPISAVWECWTTPKHITQWCSGSDDWHTPKAENDLRIGGKFHTRMEAKNGSAGFDFDGVYTAIIPNEHIAYTMEGGRTVEIHFEINDEVVTITETFEAETENSIELQRAGWQHILDNFKAYVLTYQVKS